MNHLWWNSNLECRFLAKCFHCYYAFSRNSKHCRILCIQFTSRFFIWFGWSESNWLNHHFPEWMSLGKLNSFPSFSFHSAFFFGKICQMTDWMSHLFDDNIHYDQIVLWEILICSPRTRESVSKCENVNSVNVQWEKEENNSKKIFKFHFELFLLKVWLTR